MTDKKLTDVTDNNVGKMSDSEIIKALEGAILNAKRCDSKVWSIEVYKLENALDLINRQKSEIDSAKAKIEICAEVIKRQDKEIERLKECPKCVYEYDGEVTEYCVQGPCPNFKTVEQIKAEAYKEFAETAIDRVEKAKAKYQRLCKEQGEEMEEHMHIHFNGIIRIINNLLKEMVGEEE